MEPVFGLLKPGLVPGSTLARRGPVHQTLAHVNMGRIYRPPHTSVPTHGRFSRISRSLRLLQPLFRIRFRFTQKEIL